MKQKTMSLGSTLTRAESKIVAGGFVSSKKTGVSCIAVVCGKGYKVIPSCGCPLTLENPCGNNEVYTCKNDTCPTDPCN